jgi:hypothetical protein
MANWTSEGFVGKSFQITAEMVPPPAGLPAPALWGSEQAVRQRFSTGISKLTLTRHKAVFSVDAATFGACLNIRRIAQSRRTNASMNPNCEVGMLSPCRFPQKV